ncbi:MAG: histidine kinase [Acidobacteria bacterium]|nr:histidine kinase [Acidobacteriota bacterium]
MENGAGRGKLKLFLGYAAGVGKTYQMLDEAQQLRSRGVDVVIGYFEPHGRQDTIAKTEGLEMVPRRVVEYRGTSFEEMDTAAILARHPEVCLVDEFPHTNIPGLENAKRWQDVQMLRDAGIDVLTTMNVQHLESLNDQVWQISGVKVRETIPDWIVQQADEVVMVDLPPQALVNRLLRGVVYAPDKAQKALENFFQESTLGALRELALRQTAHALDSQQQEGNTAEQPARSSERILIHVTSEPSSAMVIRRGKRVADYLHGDCFAVAVQATPEEREALERHLNFARNLHIEVRVLEDADVARALVEFAHRNGITQIFLARPGRRSWPESMRRNLVQKIVALARDMQVTIVAERKPSG